MRRLTCEICHEEKDIVQSGGVPNFLRRISAEGPWLCVECYQDRGPPEVYQRDCLGDGYNAVRPCAFAACRYWLDDGQCAMDLAHTQGGMTLVELAKVFRLRSKEAVRQIQNKALRKLDRILRDSDDPDVKDAVAELQRMAHRSDS